jgi:hypothetical protein
MRLGLVAGLTGAIALAWLASWALGLHITQSLATLLVIPYAGLTAYLAWNRTRAR